MNRFVTYSIYYIPSKLLNLLLKNGIGTRKVIYSDKSLTLTINEKDEIKLKKILNDLECKYQIIGDFGLLNFLKKLWSRKGIIAGLLIALIFVTLFSNASFFVVNKNMKSIDNDNVTEIINEYKKNDLYFKINDAEKKEIKNKIVGINGISNCEIEKKGLFLIVDIKNTLDDANFIDSKSEPITSSYNAIVTKVICLEGTPVVKKDQTVKKGDILIENSRTINEQKFQSNANGEIYGRVFYHNRKLFNKTSMEKVKTGNFITCNELEFLNIKTKNNNEIPYSKYIVEVQKIKLFNLLPLTVNRYIISEYTDELITYNLDDVKSTISSIMVNDIKNEIKCDFKILNTNTIVKSVDNYYVVDVYLEVEHRID